MNRRSFAKFITVVLSAPAVLLAKHKTSGVSKKEKLPMYFVYKGWDCRITEMPKKHNCRQTRIMKNRDCWADLYDKSVPLKRVIFMLKQQVDLWDSKGMGRSDEGLKTLTPEQRKYRTYIHNKNIW